MSKQTSFLVRCAVVVMGERRREAFASASQKLRVGGRYLATSAS